mmetsp:Transcript_3835/g.9737  ORF Transcript_3835/g.9737 Transcript_3835/m.9737 type:complete len:112 (+) Transcript_3835:1701-2036(+)
MFTQWNWGHDLRAPRTRELLIPAASSRTWKSGFLEMESAAVAVADGTSWFELRRASSRTAESFQLPVVEVRLCRKDGMDCFFGSLANRFSRFRTPQRVGITSEIDSLPELS